MYFPPQNLGVLAVRESCAYFPMNILWAKVQCSFIHLMRGKENLVNYLLKEHCFWLRNGYLFCPKVTDGLLEQLHFTEQVEDCICSKYNCVEVFEFLRRLKAFSTMWEEIWTPGIILSVLLVIYSHLHDLVAVCCFWRASAALGNLQLWNSGA